MTVKKAQVAKRLSNSRDRNQSGPQLARKTLAVAVSLAILGNPMYVGAATAVAVSANEDGARAAAAVGESANASVSNMAPSASSSGTGVGGDTSTASGAAASASRHTGSTSGAAADADAAGVLVNSSTVGVSGVALENIQQTGITATANTLNDAVQQPMSAAAAASNVTSNLGSQTVSATGSSPVSLTGRANATATATSEARDGSSGGNVRAEAAAASAAFAKSVLFSNSIAASGSIVNGAGSGILLSSTSLGDASAIANAYADGNNDNTGNANNSAYADALATAYAYSEAVIGGVGSSAGNTITLSGSITSTGSGIGLIATSNGRAVATATAAVDTDDGTSNSVTAIANTVTGTETTSPKNFDVIEDLSLDVTPENGEQFWKRYISNSGTVRSEGVALIGHNSIVIQGSLTTSAGAGVELLAQAGNGQGLVLTHASSTVSNNSITNTGSILAGGTTGTDGLDGIRLRATAVGGVADSAAVNSNMISNSGMIYALDDGIELSASDGDSGDSISSNTITNSFGGRIVARNIGISVNDLDSADTVAGNSITNSGLIVSDPGMTLVAGSLVKGATSVVPGVAVQITGDAAGTNNLVALNPRSYVAGEFRFEVDSEVNVSLTSGVSHSVRWVFEDTGSSATSLGAEAFTLSGPVPWFSNDANFASANNDGDVDVQNSHDDIFATIDPSAFAAAPNQLTDLTGMVSSMAAEGMNRSGVTRNGFWMTVRGSRMDYKGDNRATMDQDTRLQGGAFGFNRDFGDLRVGVMAGYADSELEVGSFYSDLYRYSHENKADGGFAGVHVQGNLGAVKVGLGIMAGAMDHEDRRFVNDNLQWWGESYARATYDSRWYAPELSLSVPVAITETVTLTPSLHGRYSVQKFDRYTETGSNSNATVHDHTIKMGEVRAGLDLTKKYAGGSTAGVQLGYIQRDLAGSDTVRVTMIGDTKNVPMFTRELGAGYASVKLNLAVTKAVSFQLDGTYVSGSEGKGGNVGAKLNVEF